MSEEIKVDVKMQATRFKATFDFIEKGRASGIDYMLLKMIGYAEKTSRILTVADIMSIFSISGDLLPFILSEIENLMKKDMIRHEGKSLNKDTKMKNLVFTPSGRKMFEQGFITTDNGTFEKSLLYFPARKNHYEVDKEIITLGVMARKNVDDRDFKTYIESHKSQFGMGDHAEISGRIKTETTETFAYFQPVHLLFNSTTGRFDLSSNTGLDLEYVHSHVQGNALIEKIPESKFSMEESVPFKVNRWSSKPEGEVTYLLPCDYVQPHGFALFNGNVISEVGIRNSIAVSEEVGSDIIIISGAREGYRYWFVDNDKPLSGFEDVSKSRKFIAQKKMTPGDIKKSIRTAFDRLNIGNTDDLKVMNSITRTVQEPALFSKRISEEFKESDIDAIRKILENLNTLESKIWRQNLCEEIDEILTKRVSNGMDPKEANNIAELCNKSGYPLKSVF